METVNAITGTVAPAVGALKLGISQQTLVMLWIGIVVYLAFMLFIGFWSSRRITGMSDFLVAGRRLPLWMATATLLATWFGCPQQREPSCPARQFAGPVLCGKTAPPLTLSIYRGIIKFSAYAN